MRHVCHALTFENVLLLSYVMNQHTAPHHSFLYCFCY